MNMTNRQADLAPTRTFESTEDFRKRMQDENEAFDEGVNDFQNGRSRDHNPYDPVDEPELFDAWLGGFNFAADDEARQDREIPVGPNFRGGYYE